jgi:predicted alpha/beta hydrolase
MNASSRNEISPALRVEIPTTDDYCLIGSLFQPRNDLRRVVIIAPAMGVGQTFYHYFARFLENRGFTVLTFDYRGIGASATGSARSSQADLYQWGRIDIASVISWIIKRRPEDRLLYVGHSVGTQLLGLTPAVQKIQGLVAVTAPNGYWRLWSGSERLKLFLYWHIAFPLATSILGYFPAKRLGLGLDLPGGIARDWTRWARTPGYVVDEQGQPILEHFQSLRGPVLAYSFTDDARAISRSVTELLSCFSSASVEHHQIDPAKLGLAAIGHMGYFRDSETLRTTLWTETSDWLSAV